MDIKLHEAIIQGGGGGCFPSTVRVLTTSGYVNISEIKVGDTVISYDSTGRLSKSTVEHVFFHKDNAVHKYTYWDGELLATPIHWVLTHKNSFKEIGKLSTDCHDCLVDYDNNLRPYISSVPYSIEDVYNLSVVPDHTYIVEGIRVHNGGGGGKGGGGAGRAATEADDTLNSIQYAKLLDAVCEGEIVGLVDGLKSIYFDDVPLQNSDGSFNFQRVSVDIRTGTQSQTPIIGFDSGVEAEHSVAVQVVNNTPIVRTVVSSSIGRVRVTLSTPRLSTQDSATGDISGATLEYKVSIQSNGGGFVDKVINGSTIGVLTGKTTSKYAFSHEFLLSGGAPYDIKVTRVTIDAPNSSIQDQLYWDSYTEINDTSLSYPNTALIGISIDSKQFKSIPKRSYNLKLKKVLIPNNYNPITRVYTGIWNGGFTNDWTDNPAWCFYDLVTNSRYGLGEYIPADWIDVASLYSISQYCDELVPSGYGYMEPRYTCNLYLQSQEDAFKVVQNMASIFRAMIYWQGGLVVPVADKPENVWAQFTNADVVDGLFSYQGSATKARHTVALVTWNDPLERYKQKVEYVEDTEGITRYGVNQIEVNAMGCTSRGQAHRMGKWLLYSERLETEIIIFKAGLKGVSLLPGKIINTMDYYRSGIRNAGRILAATSTSVTIDSPITIHVADTYNVSLEMPDGTIATRVLNNTDAASVTVLTWATPLSAVPNISTIWMISEEELEPETWRVLSIAEENNNLYEVTALAHNSSKYNFIEQNIAFSLPVTSIFTQSLVPEIISTANVSDSIYSIGNKVAVNKINISWDLVP